MPYLNVHVDESDMLDELSDDALIREVKHRKLSGAGIGPNYTIPQKVARDAIIEAADTLRNMGKLSLAFKLDEMRVDFVEQ